METQNLSNTTQFPVQTIPDSKKTKKWMQDCVDAAENLYIMDTSNVRSTWYNKRINQNLRNNILIQQDVEKVINPSGIKISTNPDRMAHQGLGNSKIMLLKGEESKRLRKYNFKVFKTSSDDMGVSDRELEMKNMIIAKMQEMIQSSDLEEQEIENKLKELQKYARYSYQDLQEIVANKILRYEYERLNLADKITDAWEQLLTFGEEIMAVEVYGNDLYTRNVNPLNFFCLLSPNSNLIEDSDVMIEYDYMTIRSVVDLYYDELTVDQIKSLETTYQTSSMAGIIKPGFNRNITIEERFGFTMGEITPSLTGPGMFSGPFDMRGNVRVMRVCWKTSRKLGKLKSYDELGVPVYSIVPEGYKINKSLGEEIEWFIVNEWMEGHKIGTDIYTRLRVIPYQQRSQHNLSECLPPYTGIISNFNQTRAMSLLDYMKQYDYLYDVIFYRYTEALAKYKGPITVLNRSMIPSEIDPITYMNFVDSTNYMLLDPSNEIMRGPNSGKSAGMFNTLTASVINAPMGEFVRNHIEMLSFIEAQLDKISGINSARQGTTEGDEKVSVNNMNWTASNSMTEPYYRLHDYFKRNLLKRILNVSKYLWSINPKKATFVLDNIGIEMVSSFEDISDVEFDIHITGATDIDELKEMFKQLAHAAMQNGTMTMSQVAQMYLKDSVSAQQRYLEELEEQAAQRAAEASKAEQAAIQAEIDKEYELAYADLELEYEKLDRESEENALDRQLDIELETIKASGFAKDSDIDKDGVPDILEINKLANEKIATLRDQILKERELNNKSLVEKRKLDIEERKLREQREARISKEKIDKEKMANDLKMARIKKKTASK